uniref:Spindle assembly abnormal protein 6 homolog n=1 Tax=Erpetoichthys calabaricus TaxID=27687 RepID=A0A8C4S7N3_ERPCA
MNETLFNQTLQVQIKCKDCEDRRANIRVCIELQLPKNPIHKKDLIVRLTDDIDPFFFYNLIISEEDFQSIKLQQGLLVDFSSFPQKFIDLLQQCILEADKESPRFLLQLISPVTVLDHSPSHLNVIETNAFKHLTHLSLKFLHGTDVEIKKYLADCLKCIKDEKLLLEEKLRKTEDDLSRQLSNVQQMLSEKSKDLDRLRSEWTSHKSSLSSLHSQELNSEKQKALEAHSTFQQNLEQQRKELESSHQKSMQQLQIKLAELETANKELTERKYKSDSMIRDLKAKLVGFEDESHRAKQEVLSLRRENSTLDTECHEKEKFISQLQTRVAVLEQEIKDKDQLLSRTKEALEATQGQKVTIEEGAEIKQVQIGKLEAAVKSLSGELLKANEIINKLQGEMKMLVNKLKLKNTVTIQQEKLLSEREEKYQKEHKDLQDTQHVLRLKQDEVTKLQDQLETTTQKLEESMQQLKNSENVITWLNKQMNEIQTAKKQDTVGIFESPVGATSAVGFRNMTVAPNMMIDARPFSFPTGMNYPITSTVNSKHSLQQSFPTVPISQPSLALLNPGPGPKVHYNPPMPKPSILTEPKTVTPAEHPLQGSSNKENGEPVGLDSKYFQKRDDSIPLRGILHNKNPSKDFQKSTLLDPPLVTTKLGPPQQTSAYFPGQ